MITELQLVLIQELKCFCSKTTTVQAELTIPVTTCFEFLTFYCIRNKYIVWKCICTVHTADIYTLQVHTSTSGIVTHYIRWGCQSPNPQELYRFKWEFCVWFVWCISGT